MKAEWATFSRWEAEKRCNDTRHDKFKGCLSTIFSRRMRGSIEQKKVMCFWFLKEVKLYSLKCHQISFYFYFNIIDYTLKRHASIWEEPVLPVSLKEVTAFDATNFHISSWSRTGSLVHIIDAAEVHQVAYISCFSLDQKRSCPFGAS